MNRKKFISISLYFSLLSMFLSSFLTPLIFPFLLLTPLLLAIHISSRLCWGKTACRLLHVEKCCVAAKLHGKHTLVVGMLTVSEQKEQRLLDHGRQATTARRGFCGWLLFSRRPNWTECRAFFGACRREFQISPVVLDSIARTSSTQLASLRIYIHRIVLLKYIITRACSQRRVSV